MFEGRCRGSGRGLKGGRICKASQTVHAVPAKETAELKTKIEQLNKKIEEIEEEIKGCANSGKS